MIGKYYKHYKGGIYKVIAIAYPTNDERIIEKFDLYLKGICTETRNILDVYKDSNSNLWIFNYVDSDIAVIYKDIRGAFWIRPQSIFFENGRFQEIENVGNER